MTDEELDAIEQRISRAMPSLREPSDVALIAEARHDAFILLAEVRRWRAGSVSEYQQHRQIETPGWDTKTRCACGYKSVSKCEWALHVARELGLDGT